MSNFVINRENPPTYSKTSYTNQKSFEEFVDDLTRIFTTDYAGMVIDRIVFRCYTPYFNDGDVCEFSVYASAHSDFVDQLAQSLNVDIYDEDDSYDIDPDALSFLTNDQIYLSGSYFTSYYHSSDKVVYTNPTPDTFNTNDYIETLYQTFGDYVKIMVSYKDGAVVFDVEEYEAPY